MKIIAFLGSPRKKGNSEVLLTSFLRGAEKAGASTEIIRLCELDIKPCIGCGGCDKTGKCVQVDDMVPLYDKIIDTDRVVLASPIYFYSITAQAKAFVDRTQALWSRKRLRQMTGEWEDNPARKGFFVSVAATRGIKVFDGAVMTMKYAYDAMDMHYGGELVIRRIEHRGDMIKDTESLNLAEKAGREFME